MNQPAGSPHKIVGRWSCRFFLFLNFFWKSNDLKQPFDTSVFLSYLYLYTYQSTAKMCHTTSISSFLLSVFCPRHFYEWLVFPPWKANTRCDDDDPATNRDRERDKSERVTYLSSLPSPHISRDKYPCRDDDFKDDDFKDDDFEADDGKSVDYFVKYKVDCFIFSCCNFFIIDENNVLYKELFTCRFE